MKSIRLPSTYDFKTDVLLGTPDGVVEIVWYIDYANVPTERRRALLLRAFESIAGEDTVFAVRPFGRDEKSTRAARAVIAAGRQGLLRLMHVALLSEPGDLTEQFVISLAAELGLDNEQFTNDLASDETRALVATYTKHAEEFGPDAPGLFIDGRQYDGVWDAQSVLEAIRKPFGYRMRVATQEFFHWAAAGGLVLVVATVAALIFVNVGWAQTYEHMRETLGGFSLGDWKLELSLEQWINDGLMAVFFLLVGIEIKREMVSGELSSLANAILPILAAIGGMLVPALLYAAINWGESTAHGWGIPMATDIAFTLGLMALLGSRVPTSLKVFVSALAIADDLGAIIVIAIFYGHGFDASPLLYALGVLVVMGALNVGKVYRLTPYLMLGALLWFFIYQSGVHATLAGVLTAIALPSRKSGSLVGVAAQANALFETELAMAAKRNGVHEATISANALATLKDAVERLREPGFHLQHSIETWTNFFILPLFAFANMGVVIFGAPMQLTAPESLGVIVGLMLGKPLGIVLTCWLAVRLGVAKLAVGVSWEQMIGGGCLAGVGFTMSIFIATAAFDGAQLQGVKLSILIASGLAATLGMAVLYRASRRDQIKTT